jgi:hypothetical protein
LHILFPRFGEAMICAMTEQARAVDVEKRKKQALLADQKPVMAADMVRMAKVGVLMGQ